MQGSGEGKSERGDDGTPYGKIVYRYQRMGAVADPAYGGICSCGAQHAQHGYRDSRKALARCGGRKVPIIRRRSARLCCRGRRRGEERGRSGYQEDAQ